MNKKAFVIRTKPDQGIWESLKNGKARFSWSYDDDLDLHMIQSNSPDSRDEREQDAWGGRAFLEDVDRGDYLFYIGQPENDQFVIVQVTGDYEYDDSGGDFRSYRRCELVTQNPVQYDSPIVNKEIKDNFDSPGRIHQMNHDVFQMLIMRSAVEYWNAQ